MKTKLGAIKNVNGKRFECLGHYPCGKPRWVQVNKFRPGEAVKVIGLVRGCKFDCVIVKARPLLAKITTPDPVWHGCEIKSESNLRKVRA
jgi:hypothetical protein